MRAPNIREATLARLRRTERDRANRAVTLPTQSPTRGTGAATPLAGPSTPPRRLRVPSTPQALRIIAPTRRTAG